MSTRRLVITAVLSGRSQSAVARDYGVTQGWVSRLMARYAVEGEAAFQPRSRRPKTSPAVTPAATVDLIAALRQQLSAAGLDAGPDTIVWHLLHHHDITVSRATVARHLTALGLVVPQPQKRPKSSLTRFEAAMPNECWQADFTHYRLAGPGGVDVEILSFIDDHSRYALSVTTHIRVTATIVVDCFRDTAARHGTPASTLTDNGMVFTTRLSGGKGGRNGFEHELRRLGVTQKNSRPNHPTTCGKVERFQQTLKKWLRAQPVQPITIHELQTLLDAFADEYNTRRPHRSLPDRATPATAYVTRPKATPGDRSHDSHDRVRHDRVDKAGKITLRHQGRLYSIGIGRTHTRTRVIVLVHDLDIRIVNAATGEVIRDLTLDPTRRYQPTGKPTGRPPGRTKQEPPPK
jgi:transposase InsO family protein